MPDGGRCGETRTGTGPNRHGGSRTPAGTGQTATAAAEPQPAPAQTAATGAEIQAEPQTAPEPAPDDAQPAPDEVQPAGGGTQPENAAVAAEAAPDAELIFLDFAGFDEDLSRAMGDAASRIQIAVPAAFSLNAVPDRLQKWFSRIDRTGGYVQARPKPRGDADLTRGIVGALIDIAVAAYEAQGGRGTAGPGGCLQCPDRV